MVKEECKILYRDDTGRHAEEHLGIRLRRAAIRGIIDSHLREAGASARLTLESNSIFVLFSHVRTGKWASIIPLSLIETFGLRDMIKTGPIVGPDASHLVGWIAAYREPHTPIISALLSEARRISRIGLPQQ